MDDRRDLRHDSYPNTNANADTDPDAYANPDTNAYAYGHEETSVSRLYACQLCERFRLYSYG